MAAARSLVGCHAVLRGDRRRRDRRTGRTRLGSTLTLTQRELAAAHWSFNDRVLSRETFFARKKPSTQRMRVVDESPIYPQSHYQQVLLHALYCLCPLRSGQSFKGIPSSGWVSRLFRQSKYLSVMP